jgi:hypothetical protein
MAQPFITSSGNFNVTQVTGRFVLGTTTLLCTDTDVAELTAQFSINYVFMAINNTENPDALSLPWRNVDKQFALIWDSVLGDGWYDDGTPKSTTSFITTTANLLSWVVAGLQGNMPAPHFLLVSPDENRASLFLTFVRAAIAGTVGSTPTAIATATYAQIQAIRPTITAFATPAYKQSCIDALVALG